MGVEQRVLQILERITRTAEVGRRLDVALYELQLLDSLSTVELMLALSHGVRARDLPGRVRPRRVEHAPTHRPGRRGEARPAASRPPGLSPGAKLEASPRSPLWRTVRCATGTAPQRCDPAWRPILDNGGSITCLDYRSNRHGTCSAHSDLVVRGGATTPKPRER